MFLHINHVVRQRNLKSSTVLPYAGSHIIRRITRQNEIWLWICWNWIPAQTENSFTELPCLPHPLLPGHHFWRAGLTSKHWYIPGPRTCNELQHMTEGDLKILWSTWPSVRPLESSHILFNTARYSLGAWVSVVVKALRYKSVGPGIDSKRGRLEFILWQLTFPCARGRLSL